MSKINEGDFLEGLAMPSSGAATGTRTPMPVRSISTTTGPTTRTTTSASADPRQSRPDDGTAIGGLSLGRESPGTQVPKARQHAQPGTATGATAAVAEHGETNKRILDPCCGSRMFWFDRKNQDVVFGDKRREKIIVTDRSHGNTTGQRTLHIEPDVLMDFRALPYPDGQFNLVSFDPPHLIKAGNKSWLAAKYGKLSNSWQDDIRQGFSECFRVLATNGVLVFKWNETQVKIREVLALTPEQPLFGHPTGRRGLTHWYVFMKPSA